MKRFFAILIYTLSLTVVFTSCSSNQNSAANSDVLLPFSVGKINSLYFYVDQYYNNSPLKDSLDYYFNQPYLLTPNMSPVVDLVNYNFEEFANGNSQTANNLVLVNVDEESFISDYAKAQLGLTAIDEALVGKQIAMVRVTDVNAKPQQLFYLMTKGPIAMSDPKIRSQIQDYVSTIIEETTALDNTRILSNLGRNRNLSMEAIVADEFGFSMWLPREYEVVIEEPNFLWLIRETNELYSNITMYRAEFDSSKKLEDQVLPVRDKMGEYITTKNENTRMTTHTSSKPYPIQRQIKLGDRDGVETRGLWKMVNDQLGGGFVNYTFVNSRGELIAVDGFVYFSGNDKRRQMRDIDALMSTLEVN